MAPAHVNAKVAEKLKKGILVVIITPAGMTSTLQVCDTLCNRKTKVYVKTGYNEWRVEAVSKLRQEHGTGADKSKMKLKTPRKTVVRIVKDAIKKYNQDQKKTPTIRAGFKKLGQDCYDKDLAAFKAYLSDLQLLTLTSLTTARPHSYFPQHSTPRVLRVQIQGPSRTSPSQHVLTLTSLTTARPHSYFPHHSTPSLLLL